MQTHSRLLPGKRRRTFPAVAPTIHTMKFAQKFLSRKYLAKVAGVVFAALSARYPELQPALVPVAAVTVAYIAGESLIDAVREAAGAPLQAVLRGAMVSRISETLRPIERNQLLASTKDTHEA